MFSPIKGIILLSGLPLTAQALEYANNDFMAISDITAMYTESKKINSTKTTSSTGFLKKSNTTDPVNSTRSIKELFKASNKIFPSSSSFQLNSFTPSPGGLSSKISIIPRNISSSTNVRT